MRSALFMWELQGSATQCVEIINEKKVLMDLSKILTFISMWEGDNLLLKDSCSTDRKSTRKLIFFCVAAKPARCISQDCSPSTYRQLLGSSFLQTEQVVEVSGYQWTCLLGEQEGAWVLRGGASAVFFHRERLDKQVFFRSWKTTGCQ